MGMLSHQSWQSSGTCPGQGPVHIVSSWIDEAIGICNERIAMAQPLKCLLFTQAYSPADAGCKAFRVLTDCLPDKARSV